MLSETNPSPPSPSQISPSSSPRFVVLTGGPGAGKTALLEIIRRSLCPHVAILPESASILFGGGFWRRPSTAGRKAAQRAIYHVQSEQERMVREEQTLHFCLCDRGTIDGVAYWPEDHATFWNELQTTPELELARYYAVVHLRTPSASQGYNHENPLRTEIVDEALAIDDKILRVWQAHPRRYIVDSTEDFLTKATHALQILQEFLPNCCPRQELHLTP